MRSSFVQAAAVCFDVTSMKLVFHFCNKFNNLNNNQIYILMIGGWAGGQPRDPMQTEPLATKWLGA